MSRLSSHLTIERSDLMWWSHGRFDPAWSSTTMTIALRAGPTDQLMRALEKAVYQIRKDGIDPRKLDNTVCWVLGNECRLYCEYDVLQQGMRYAIRQGDLVVTKLVKEENRWLK